MKKKLIPTIEGNRIYFSEVNRTDFSEIANCLKHTLGNFDFDSGLGEPNETLIQNHYNESVHNPDWLFWVIREKTEKKPLVGISDVRLNHPQADEATIELLLIDQQLQNQGYGHEALQAIEQMIFGKVRLVRLGVNPKNKIAKDFWEKENYTSAQNPYERETRQLWYAKSRNWYERLKGRIFSYG